MNEGELKPKDEADTQSKRLENIFVSLTKCKNDFITEREECRKIREINIKLEIELKEARELEKSQRYQLLSTREMIGNLQDTVSQLVYLKRNEKKMKEELILRECTISTMANDKENLISIQKATILELRNTTEKHIEELTAINERKMQQNQNECDTRVAQLSFVIEELRSKINDIETRHRDKMNAVVLDYEEKIQREIAQVSQLQEQLAWQASSKDSNIDAYKRKIEELEEKLKQTKFKQYLAQGPYRSQYESQVERPYSVNSDYPPLAFDSDLERPVPKTPHSTERFQIPKTPHLNETGRYQIPKTPQNYNKELNFNDKGPNFTGFTNPYSNTDINKCNNPIRNKGPNFSDNKEHNFNKKGPHFNEIKDNVNKCKQNKLQIMYNDKPSTIASKTEKGTFKITKKRKLYNEKDFQDC